MERLVGVDVARGLAVLGMVTAHVGPGTPHFWTATGWLQVADGRSAATFAVLAGLSTALLSGGRRPPASLRGPRVRIAVRAALLGVLGVALQALGTPVAVILPGYALMLLTLLPVLGLRARALLTLAGVALLLGPPLVLSVSGPAPAGSPGLAPGLLVGPYYPAVVWIAYLLVGLAVGRLDLRSSGVRVRLASLGALATAAGYGAGALALRVLPRDDTWWRSLLAGHPHANTAPEVVGNLGVVLLVLVGSLVLADRFPRAVAPLAATGQLALTAYCAHIVVIAVLGPGVVYSPTALSWLTFLVVIVGGCTAWRARYGRGPLERALHEASTRAAAAATRDTSARVSPAAP
ncbi:MAG TPA: heparan-alpha-glucosaminide N-acetyltransferase domain-containing protein [Actinotalea sp.]|nr:heparan-alpha-glucosaminide N-acetyltransferase domain-containing protein [Actinotalea sp.]